MIYACVIYMRGSLLPLMAATVLPIRVANRSMLPATRSMAEAEQRRRAAEEESFNVYLSSGRMVIECAFGRLKGRFLKLQKRMDLDASVVPKVVTACCILVHIGANFT